MKISTLWIDLRILLAAGFTVAVAGALGRRFLRWCGAWKVFTGLERPVFAFAIGAACLSDLVFLLCAAQLAYAAVFGIVGAVVLWLEARHNAPPSGVPAGETASRTALWIFLPIAVCYGYLYLMHAMAPETSGDGAGYHLGFVSRYLSDHGFSRITTSMYAMLSQGVEMLFVFAFALGRHSAAKMIHFAFLVATVPAILAFARRFGLESKGSPVGATAAAFFVISPVIGVTGTACFNDVALAFFTFLTFYLVLLWEERQEAALLPVVGIVAGFCYAIKYTGFLALPFALVFLSRKREAWSGLWRRLATVALFAALFIVPWMIKNAIVVKNPVAPFFNSLFPNPYFHVSFERIYRLMMRQYNGFGEHDWREYLRAPWELTMVGDRLQGLFGPLFLLAPLGLWSLRRRIGRRLWLAAALFALPWLSNAGTRFLIPALAFVSLAMAIALWQAPRKVAAAVAGILVTAHAAASWPSVLELYNRGWHLGDPPWRAALHIEREADYLRHEFPLYNIGVRIDDTVPRGQRVMILTGMAESYTARELVGTYQSALGELLADRLGLPIFRDNQPTWNIRLEWPTRELEAVRIIQTASHETELWSIHDLVLFSGSATVKPQSSWRLRARPNPWDAAMAMDGNPVTRWRSWWPLYPGMFYQVDFPGPMMLSAVDLRCSTDQYHIALAVEGRERNGRWSPLDARETRTLLNGPREPLRKLATQELKRYGVDYLLTDLDGGGLQMIARDIEKDPAAWGLTQMWEYGPMRLYRIEALRN